MRAGDQNYVNKEIYIIFYLPVHYLYIQVLKYITVILSL